MVEPVESLGYGNKVHGMIGKARHFRRRYTVVNICVPQRRANLFRARVCRNHVRKMFSQRDRRLAIAGSTIPCSVAPRYGRGQDPEQCVRITWSMFGVAA